MDKHTPEPWKLHGNFKSNNYILGGEPSIVIVTAYGNLSTEEADTANAQRIVACVNALSGIEDPEKWVEDMKAENQRLKEEVAKLTKMYTDNEGFTRRIAKELRELKASKP